MHIYAIMQISKVLKAIYANFESFKCNRQILKVLIRIIKIPITILTNQ